MNPPDPPNFLLVLHSKSNSNSFISLTKRETNASKHTSQASKHTRVYQVFNYKRLTTTTYSSPSLSVPVQSQLSPIPTVPPTFLSSLPSFHTTTDQHHDSPALRLHPTLG